MKRKLLILPLLGAFLFGCAKNASDDLGENPQGLAFYLQDDGTYGVGVGNAFCLTNIEVPSTYKGKPVTKVIEYGFSHLNTVFGQEASRFKNVTLPESIKEIGDEAFQSTTIETIKLPKSLKKVGENCFWNTPIKKIEYASKLDSFKKIKFGERWVNYDCNVSFKFADQNRDLNSFKRGLDLSLETHLLEYNAQKVSIDDEILVSYNTEELERYIYVSELYEDFLNLNKNNTKKINFTCENEDNTVLTISHNDELSTGFQINLLSLGETNVTVRTNVYEKTFKIKVVEAIECDLATLESYFETDKRVRFYDLFSVEGYASISGYWVLIKKTLDSEPVFRIGYTEELTDIEENMHLRVVGQPLTDIFGSNRAPYFNHANITILE